MPDSPVSTTVETQFCDNCGAEVAYGDLSHNEQLGLAVCEDCDLDNPELHSCSECGTEYEEAYEADDCCRFECPECGTEYRNEEEALECCSYSCQQCGASFEYESDAQDCCRPSGRDYGGLAPLLNPYVISIPGIEGRRPRRCSVEQEVTKGGPEAAQMLYDYGFAVESGIQYYSWSPDPGRIGVCEDGSLPGAGGEVKYSRFNLADPGQFHRFSEAVGRMRQLAREAGCVRVDKSAGTHIHIDVTDVDGKRIGPVEMTALHELFCFAEDAVYGVAAAGWDNGHRQSPSSGGYCRPVPKIDQANAWRINRAMRTERYFGLNFGRLLRAAASCSCGAAQFGAWEDCECGVFDSATVEWRVFNASTKPETIHAWLLLAHAMTAHAFRHEVGTLPVNAYGTGTPDQRWETLNYLFEILPLTEAEIEVVRDAAMRSPLFRR